MGAIVREYVGDGGRPDKRSGYVEKCLDHPGTRLETSSRWVDRNDWATDLVVRYTCPVCGASKEWAT